MFEALSLVYGELLAGLNAKPSFEILRAAPAVLRITFKCAKTRREAVIERLKDGRALNDLWEAHFPKNELLVREPTVETLSETSVRIRIAILTQAVE
jgi:hypothetical protein